ncbi:phage tail tip lysozyme [Corynebacterium mastitidis]|uniref:phage tail tip lysozyme n=1 Tax=Corynebacterium mastitidis TaxID=161890 RepID=UPI0003A6C4AE
MKSFNFLTATALTVITTLSIAALPVLADDKKDDDITPRFCTPDEVDFLYQKGMYGPQKSHDDDVPPTSGTSPGQSDWLTPGTQAYDVAQEVYDFFTGEIGTSGAFAAGVLANINHESGGTFDPQISEGFGRFPTPESTTPDKGGPGGGLYQFTPYEKYVQSPHFLLGGWRATPESQYVWDSEFKTGAAFASLAVTPANYGQPQPFDRGFTAVTYPWSNTGEDIEVRNKILLDKDAWVTTDDPKKAAAAFQMGYERPAAYHTQREEWAIQANKVFNKDNYPGDEKKLAQALPAANGLTTAGNIGGSALTRVVQALQDRSRAKKKESKLFQSPCIVQNKGDFIKNRSEAQKFANKNGKCVSTASGRKGKKGEPGSDSVNSDVTILNEDKLQKNAKDLAHAVAEKFKGRIDTIGGWRPFDRFPDHPSGRAIDVMIPNYSSVEGKVLGDEVYDFIWQHGEEYNVEYTIWQQKYDNKGDGGSVMEDRGSDTENHLDHVHVTTDGSGYSGRGQQNRKGKGGSASPEYGCRRGGTASAGSVQPNEHGAVIPTIGQYTSPFTTGPRQDVAQGDAAHKGIDIANEPGTSIYAFMDGKVISAGPASGFGNWVRIEHSDGTVTVYGHMRSFTVSEGDEVKAGDQIAEMGSEGFSTGSHLHFEIHPQGYGNAQDPVPIMQDLGLDFPSEVGQPVTAGK